MATYPLPKFHFFVVWGGVRVGFTEVTGLDMQVEAIEYREGFSPEYSKVKMPGMHKFSNLTLKRGSVAGDSNEMPTIPRVFPKTLLSRYGLKMLNRLVEWWLPVFGHLLIKPQPLTA